MLPEYKDGGTSQYCQYLNSLRYFYAQNIIGWYIIRKHFIRNVAKVEISDHKFPSRYQQSKKLLSRALQEVLLKYMYVVLNGGKQNMTGFHWSYRLGLATVGNRGMELVRAIWNPQVDFLDN